jgi:hypothetical protein
VPLSCHRLPVSPGFPPFTAAESGHGGRFCDKAGALPQGPHSAIR